MDALRADQWLENHPEADDAHAPRDQAAGARRVLHRHRRVEGADRRAGRSTPRTARCGASPPTTPEAAMSTATAGPCDRGVADAVAARPGGAKPTAHPTGTLAATILGSSLAYIDGSVVNVALPAIGARPRRRRRRPVLADQRLPAAARSAAAARRRRRRPLGQTARVPRRHGAVHPRLARLRPGAQLRPAARGARRPRARRRFPDAGEPRPDRRRVQRRGSRPRRRHLGSGRGDHVRARAARRRLAGRCRRLAHDLPRQPADRAGRRLARLALRRGEPRAATPRRSTAAARCSRPRAWRH